MVAYVHTSAANRQTKAANDDLTKALDAEQEQRERAENTSAAALEAMNRIYDRFAPNRIIVALSLPSDGSTEDRLDIPPQPTLPPEAVPLLEELLEFYEQFGARGERSSASSDSGGRSQSTHRRHNCVDWIVEATATSALAAIHSGNLLLGRKLDTSNPNPSNIGSDFNRFGFLFWPAVDADHLRNSQRRVALENLNRWRNAIAHSAFTPVMVRGGRPSLQLSEVQNWRRACDGLARSFDAVMRAHLLSVTGTAPW